RTGASRTPHPRADHTAAGVALPVQCALLHGSAAGQTLLQNPAATRSAWVARRLTMVPPLSVYTTCPPSQGTSPDRYAASVRDVSRWSEGAGCLGMLVYADNRLVDPWLVAQLVILATERLVPLVAVQPVYMHPYSVAKLMASLAGLHGRRVDLNMIA